MVGWRESVDCMYLRMGGERFVNLPVAYKRRQKPPPERINIGIIMMFSAISQWHPRERKCIFTHICTGDIGHIHPPQRRQSRTQRLGNMGKPITSAITEPRSHIHQSGCNQASDPAENYASHIPYTSDASENTGWGTMLQVAAHTDIRLCGSRVYSEWPTIWSSHIHPPKRIRCQHERLMGFLIATTSATADMFQLLSGIVKTLAAEPPA